MRTQDVTNSKVLKGFVKGSLVIIGLFIVLSCGVASLVLLYKYCPVDIVFKLISILAVFILIFLLIVLLIVLLSFCCLTELQYKKLLESSCTKYENIFRKMAEMSKENLEVANDIKRDSGIYRRALQNQLKEIKEILERLLKKDEKK